MAAVAQHSNVLYTSSGLFLHPDRFLRRTKVVKDAKGNDVTVSSFRPGHIFNAVFDETDPLNPEKNNIEVYADIYGDKGKENTKYKVRFRDQSIKYMVLPPLAVRSTELGPNGNFGKGEKNPNKNKPEAARYSACLDGMAYDDAVKDPEDPWQRNKDYVKLEALLNRLKLWAIMYIWQSPAGKIKSQTRNFLKDMQARDKAKDPHAADISMEEVVAQFEVNPHLCRGLVCVPQERDDATEPAESRSYIVWNRRTFAKVKTDDKKKSGYNGPSKKPIDNDPCPDGFRRMPLGILSYKIDYADRKAKARYMTRAEIDQIRRGDVMSAMVHITLGVDDKNPTNSDIYPLNMKFEGAQDDDLWFGSGHNGSQARNADQEIELDDSEDVHMDHVPEARKAYVEQAKVPAENAEAAPMEVDSPSTVALKRKGREYDPEDEAPETETLAPVAEEEEEEEAPKPKSKKHKKTTEPATDTAKPAKGKSAFGFARNKATV